MDTIVSIQDALRKLYGTYDKYINMITRFILAFISYQSIGSTLCGVKFLSNTVIVLLMSVISVFLPTSMILVISAILILAHLAKISLITMGVVAIILIALLILFYRFTPKLAVITLVTPIAFALKIPFAIPIIVGIIVPPYGIIATICGTVSYYILHGGKNLAFNVKAGSSTNAIMEQLSVFMKKVIINKEMFLYMIMFVIICFVVYAVKRGESEYAYTIAIVVGAIVAFFGVIVGKYALGINAFVFVSLLGIVIGAGIAYIAKVFVFNVDYKKTKKIQYEDDEFYYFVRVVPKVSVTEEILKKEK